MEMRAILYKNNILMLRRFAFTATVLCYDADKVFMNIYATIILNYYLLYTVTFSKH